MQYFLGAPYESSHKTEKVWGKNTLLKKMNLKIGHKRIGHSWNSFRMSKKIFRMRKKSSE